MNYKISYNNYIENEIYETTNEVDNITIFDSFTKAKKKLLAILKMEQVEVNSRIRDVRTKNTKNRALAVN